MKRIIFIENQKDFNKKFKRNYKEFTRIEIRGKIREITYTPHNSYIVIGGNAVINHCHDNAVIKNCYDNAVINHCHGNAVINRCYDNAIINYCYDDAVIKNCYDDAVIKNCYGNAVIKNCYGNAVINRCYDNAVINHCHDNAVINYCYDNAVIKNCYGNAVINYCYDNAVIKNCYGNAVIRIYNKNKINKIRGYVTIYSYKYKFTPKVPKTCRVINIPKIKTWAEYKKRFPYKIKNKTTAIFYKAVHKIDGKYFSHHKKDFEYKIGQIVEHKVVKQHKRSCDVGLHVAYYYWAKTFGANWNDLAILEVEVPINKIIIAEDCDGKVRTSRLKVIREVPENFEPNY